MKKLFLLIFLLVYGFTYAQDEQVVTSSEANLYPEGVYLNYRDFISKTPSNQKRVEARDVLNPKRKINDPSIDNCYFNYIRNKKRVKDAFAISYKGSMYFHVKSLQKLMEKKDRKQKIDFKDSFIRVVGQGKYLYMEGYFKKGGGLGFSIGGGPISIGTGGPKEELKGIIFDFEREVFDLFRDCEDFNDFLITTSAVTAFKCDKKALPLEIVRNLIFQINHDTP